jgi:hypothetical protein
LISTIGISLHPAIRKERFRLPKDAKPTEKLPQPYPLNRTSANSLSFSSEVSKFARDPNIFPSRRKLNFTKDSITPSQVEAPVSPGMNPSSPQPEASNLPGTPPASPQLEASALPETSQAPPQLITQELPLETERIPPRIQETRNEVSMGIQFCYSLSINHP